MRRILQVVSFIAMASCARENEVKSTAVKQFIEKLNMLSSGYEYNLVSENDRGYYETVSADSLFFSEYVLVIGYLPDTSQYYSILYLSAGDDLYPSLKVLAKSGHQLDSQVISYGDCAAGGCEIDSCISTIKLMDRHTILSALTLITLPCDSHGKRIEGGERNQIKKKQRIKVTSGGTVEFGAEEIVQSR